MSGDGCLKQRNIQKNVNVDLYLGARSQVDASHHWPEAAAFGVTPSQAAEQGWVCATPLSPGQREPSLIQTNLSCPSQLFQDTTSQFSGSCFQQQNNLCFRLQQHSSKYVAHRTPHLALSVHPPVKLPQRRSHLEAYNLEGNRNENIDFPQQHHQKAKAVGTCSIPAHLLLVPAHHHRLEGRNKNGDYPIEKQQPRAVSCVDPGNPSLVNQQLSFHTVDSLRHKSELCLFSRGSGDSVNACHSSALTLGDLSLSNLEFLQALLQSSHIFAGLYCSIWRLKQEIALMGTRGSLPLVPSSSPGTGSLCFAPDDSAYSTLSTREQLAGEKNSAAQARLKWGIPFAKGWSLDAAARDLSHAEPISVSHGYGYVDSSMWRTKLSGDIWPERLSAGVGSGSIVDTKADSSNNCSPHFRCQSRAKSTLEETGGLYVHTKIHSSEKVLKGAQTSGGALTRPISWKKDLPASLYPEGLQVSLETCFEGAQMNVGVAMYGTPREVCVRVASPGDQECRPIQQLSIRPAEVRNCEPPVESSKALEEVCDFTSQAARRMTVAGSSQSSPASIQVAKHFGEYSDIECLNVSREGRRNKCSYQSSWRNWEADANLDFSEDPSMEMNVKEPECCEEGSQAQEIASREVSENSCWSLKVNEQSFQHLHDRQIVTRCFQAWRDHVLWKRAAARQLYRRQLLQKGLSAFQGAVHLRRMQLEVAQQRHASALLAASFRKWNEAVAKRGKKQAPQPAPYSYAQSSSVGFSGLGRLATMTTSAQRQLTASYLKEAEQACRVESELWTQLHRRQKGDEFCWGTQANRDMRWLAAAFRLWRLQKELLSKEEARLLEARALLEKKRLRNIFQVWRSQCLEMKKILHLTTCSQRNLVSRCFSVWKETVEQKAFYRCNLAHLRVESLRKYFQQWVQMLQIRESNKQVMVNFFLLRWRQHYGPAASSVADETATERHDIQPWWTAVRWFPEKTGYSLDDLCLKVKLQRVYLLWKARLYEHHRADSFAQALEQYRLRKALKVWHLKLLMLKTIEPSPKHSHGTVCEEPLALLFCEDFSTSSGFHSSNPATLASQSSLEKEYSFSDSSQQSCSSILTAEDVTCAPYYSSFLQLHQHAELTAELDGELYLQASFPSRRTGSRENWFMGSQFQSLALQNPESNVQPLVGNSTWKEDCGSERELKSCWHQAEKSCVQRVFLRWHHRAVENQNQEAAAALKHQVHCCQTAFSLWKKRLVQKVEADQRFRCHIQQITADALWRWHSYCQRNCAMRELQQRWVQHSHQKKKRLVLQTWYCQTRQLKNAALFQERLLLHRCLIIWVQVTAYRLRQHEALSSFKRVREHHLLVASFAEWRVKFLTAKQQVLREERNHKWQGRSQAKACLRWRLASRGQQAFRLGSVAAVKQACNYWTKTAAFSQCLRQCSTLIGARKNRKMSLSWSLKRRGCREKASVLASSFGLFPSAVRRWLVTYRNQRTERLLLPQLLERHGLVGPAPAHARIQENKAEVDSEERDEKWLGRKYLRWWYHTVMLRRCQRDRRLRYLARGWHQWKEASRVVMLAQVLDQGRLIEKAWRAWRRRYLQNCVVQSFLEVEARSLLSQAFGRWRQLTAFQLKDKGHC